MDSNSRKEPWEPLDRYLSRRTSYINDETIFSSTVTAPLCCQRVFLLRSSLYASRMVPSKKGRSSSSSAHVFFFGSLYSYYLYIHARSSETQHCSFSSTRRAILNTAVRTLLLSGRTCGWIEALRDLTTRDAKHSGSDPWSSQSFLPFL